MNKELLRWSSVLLKDQDLQDEVKQMQSNPNLIQDAFNDQLLFGTGGLRGIIGAGTNRMNLYTVRKATFGYACTLPAGSKVAIAYDSRIKSVEFAQEAACVLANCGIKVYIFDRVSPTPLLSYAVRQLKCDGGIVITASHNPSNYNGYKVYDSKGCQINPSVADKILSKMEKIDIFKSMENEMNFAHCMDKGLITYINDDVIDSFIELVCLQSFYEGQKKLKIVYTPLNGSGYECVSRALTKNGFKNLSYVREQAYPDGRFLTCPYPNPEHEQALELGIRDLVETCSDILIATDPDCDRAGLVIRDNDDIRILNGNETGMLLLDYICMMRIKNGLMPKKPVAIKTIVTTELSKKIAQQYNVDMIEVLTGFKYIGDQIGILEDSGEVDRFIFGFEESCGYLSGSYVRDKDAVNAAVLICDMADYYRDKKMSLTKRLDQLYKEHGYLLTHLGNYEFKGSQAKSKMNNIMSKLRNSALLTKDYLLEEGALNADVLKFVFENNCTAIVRPSGTEPKIKIYYSSEGYDMIEAQNSMNKLVKIMERMIV